MTDLAPLPVKPANVVPLEKGERRDAVDFIDYITRDISGAVEACANVAQLCPKFAKSADLLRRKLVTLHCDAAALAKMAEDGCAPVEQS